MCVLRVNYNFVQGCAPCSIDPALLAAPSVIGLDQIEFLPFGFWQGKNVGGFELSGGERGHDNNPICSSKPLLGQLIAFALGVPARLAPRLRCGLCGLLDGDLREALRAG